MDRGRTGEVISNKYGTLMKIIKDNGSSIIVEFQDTYKYQVETIYQNFKKGQIKNPYDKTHCGIGYVGVGKYTTTLENGEHPLPYVKWHGILDRCYKKSLKTKYPTYSGICSTCEEWHNYQNFAEWFYNNYYDIGEGRMHLDKDILVPGNKIYSPETCIFVPQRINMLLLNKPNKRGLPNGIVKVKTGYLAKYDHEELGIYNTLNDAFSVYATEKEARIKTVAEEYKTKIPIKLYDALLRYKVLLENDKNYIVEAS